MGSGILKLCLATLFSVYNIMYCKLKTLTLNMFSPLLKNQAVCVLSMFGTENLPSRKDALINLNILYKTRIVLTSSVNVQALVMTVLNAARHNIQCIF